MPIRNTIGLTGGRSATVSGGEFSGYTVPTALRISQDDTEQLIASGAVDNRYANVGIDAPDVGDSGYWLFLWHTSNVSVEVADGTHIGDMQIFEGTGASSGDGIGTGGAFTQMNTDDHDFLYSSFLVQQRPGASRDAEWGWNLALDDADRLYANGASMMAVPVNDSLHSSSTLGVENNTYIRPVGLGTVSLDGASGSDEDIQSADATASVGAAGDYLIIVQGRVRSNTTTQARELRWTWYLDDEDLFNVRTDTTSAGATRTGRGFQIAMQALSSITPMYGIATVKALSAGSHTFHVVGNRWQGIDGGETLAQLNAYAINTNMFKQFKYEILETAKALAGSWSVVSEWTQSIVSAASTDRFMLLLSTSVHNTNSTVQFRITRNGTAITPNGADGRSLLYPSVSTTQIGSGGQSTDNNTLPFTMMWVDTPGVGVHTYRVEVQVSGAAAQINARDDGSSGYRGIFAIAELSFATAGY